jgi:replicative DNA helicase
MSKETKNQKRVSLLNTTELEARFLAKCFIANNKIAKIIDIIKLDHFQSKHNGNIYHAITELFKEDKFVDDITVISYIQNQGYCVTEDLEQYIKQVKSGYGCESSSVGIEDYAKEIVRRHNVRKISEITDVFHSNKNEYIENGSIIEKAVGLSTDITNIIYSDNHSDLKNIQISSDDYLNDIDNRIESEEEFKLSGLPFFWLNGDKEYSAFDLATDGAQKGNIISLCADSKIGKSFVCCRMITSMCQYIKYVLDNDRTIIFFSAEMSKQEIINRLILMLINLKQIKLPAYKRRIFSSIHIKHPKLFFIDNDIEVNEANKTFFKSTISSAIQEINSWNLIIEDGSYLSAEDVVNITSKVSIQNKCDIGAVFVDYAGYLNNGIPDEDENVYQSYRIITPFAKKIGAPFIILNQLLKSYLKEENDFRPNDAAYPGRGKVKKDSHLGISLYRWDRYDSVMQKQDNNGNLINWDKNNLLEVSIDIIRDGVPGKYLFNWNNGSAITPFVRNDNYNGQAILDKMVSDIKDDV